MVYALKSYFLLYSAILGFITASYACDLGKRGNDIAIPLLAGGLLTLVPAAGIGILKSLPRSKLEKKVE